LQSGIDVLRGKRQGEWTSSIETINTCLRTDFDPATKPETVQARLQNSTRVGFVWQKRQHDSPLAKCSNTPECSSEQFQALANAKVLLLRRDNTLAFSMAASNTKQFWDRYGATNSRLFHNDTNHETARVKMNVALSSKALLRMDAEGVYAKKCYAQTLRGLRHCGVDALPVTYEDLGHPSKIVEVFSFLGMGGVHLLGSRVQGPSWQFVPSAEGKHHPGGPIQYLTGGTKETFSKLVQEGRFTHLQLCHLHDDCPPE
jgi:hypothetical protein